MIVWLNGTFGAGKTTAVAPALLDQEWCTGTVILLSPRRVAARAAAERMAELLGEKPGETVGYLTRLDSKRSGEFVVAVNEAATNTFRHADGHDVPDELIDKGLLIFDGA